MAVQRLAPLRIQVDPNVSTSTGASTSSGHAVDDPSYKDALSAFMELSEEANNLGSSRPSKMQKLEPVDAHGSAHRVDWSNVVDPSECSAIIKEGIPGFEWVMCNAFIIDWMVPDYYSDEQITAHITDVAKERPEEHQCCI